MNFRIKYIIPIIIMLIFIGGAYYYFDVDADQKQNDIINDSLLDSERLARIASFTVINNDLDETTIERYTTEFNNAKEFFLANAGNLIIFQVVKTMGQLKRAVDDFSGAEEALLYAYALDPGGYIINGELASLYQYGLKNYEKAEEFYLYTLAIPNIQSGNHYTYFAELHDLYRYRIKNFEKTADLLERAMEELPQDTNIIGLAATFYKEKGDIKKAEELYKKILEINPESEPAKQGLEKLKTE